MAANTSSPDVFTYYCTESRTGRLIGTLFVITRISLSVPLSIPVLFLSHQRWRRRSPATTNHSDVFAYNAAAMALTYFLGAVLCLWGQYRNQPVVSTVGIYLSSLVFVGEVLLHILTCVERHLAVVHPVTYRGLRRSGGVRIRNTCVGCVWLLSVGWLGVMAMYMPGLPDVPYFCVLGSAFVVVLFCSLSVLRALIRPGPGEVGGHRKRVDRSKLKAFHTMTAILGVLLISLLGVLVCVAVEKVKVLSGSASCVLLVSSNWLTLPSTLVLPLQFLHRARKLPRCSCSRK